jgi:hypothetical protein
MNAVRERIGYLRYRWLGVGIGGPDATLQGQRLVLILSLTLVFACFFAIGRLHAGGGTAPLAATPSALVGPDGQPAIPAGLSGGSPIAGAVPAAIAVKPAPPPAVTPPVSSEPRVTTTVRSSAAEPLRSESPPSASPPSSATTPEPVRQPVPTKVSTPSNAGRGVGSSGRSSTTPQSAGGNSFDSSG